ncbi:hypothetical protein ACKWTF_005873 [Chironomus riparius]
MMSSKDDEIGFIESSKLPYNTFAFRRQLVQPCNQAPEDFRKYLVKKGVMDYISKYFQKLMKERPENPIEILQQNNMKEMEIEELKRKLDEANDIIQDLQIQNKRLKQDKIH